MTVENNENPEEKDAAQVDSSSDPVEERGTTSDLPDSSLEPTNVQDDESSKKEHGRHGRHKKRRIIILAVSALIVLVLGGGFGVFQYVESTTLIVPEAKSYLAHDDESDPCADLSATGLKCSVIWDTNDNIRRGAKISQSIDSGDRVKKDSSISLHYSSGPAESEFPNLSGTSLEDAKASLYNIGVEIKEIKLVDSDGRKENVVVSSSINAGDTVKNGQEVVLEVSNGKITVPDWTGKTREFVEADAKKSGIEVSFKEEENDGASGIVLSQTPKAGETSSSTPVEVVISKSFESKDITVPDVIGKSADDAQVELAAAGFRHIKTVQVKNSEVTEKQVTQVVPGVGQTGKSEENIVLIVSEPDGK